MRKMVVGSSPEARSSAAGTWLDLESLAQVEVTSEDAEFPVEHALTEAGAGGWRAAGTGPQMLRLRFDRPVTLRRIQLHIVERAAERMQELSIAVELAPGSGLREVRRQQFTFSPGGATEELEDFTVDLAGVTALELKIDPDRSHDPRASRNVATLQVLRLG